MSFSVYQNTKLFPSARLINESSSIRLLANDSGSFEFRRRIVGSRVVGATVEGVEIKNLPPDNPTEVYFELISVRKLNYCMFDS